MKDQLKIFWRYWNKVPLNRYRFSLPTLMFLSCTFANHVLASPWIEAGEEQIRHHIQTLTDDGLISSPTNTWPLMWGNIKADLDNINPNELSEGQLWSYRFLKHELRKAMNSFTVEQSAQAGNQVTAISDFSSDSRERYLSSFAANYTGERLAYKAKVSVVYHPADHHLSGHAYQPDGSYVNYLAGNWVVGAGLIDRWWGPGWESSLILSSNARPTPGVYLQRNVAAPFETQLLSWIGPWQLTTFMSVLESNRDYPNPKLWGMRVNIKPFKQFELGMSRTAQWGGEGRPNDIDTFVKLLMGKDNLDDFGADQTQDHSKEPGNQLAGFDWRWGHTFGKTSSSLYGQVIGEDEAGYLPSRSIGMAGIEISQLIGQVHARVSLEAQNTTMTFYHSNGVPNSAYEHSIYYSGYRFHGRPIGASTDNDAESLTLRGQLHFRNGHNLNLGLGHHRLNIDGTNTSDPLPGPGGSAFGYSRQGEVLTSTKQDTFKTQITYTLPITEIFLLEISAFNFSNGVFYQTSDFNPHDSKLSIVSAKLNSGGFVRLRASY